MLMVPATRTTQQPLMIIFWAKPKHVIIQSILRRQTFFFRLLQSTQLTRGLYFLHTRARGALTLA